MGIVELFGYLMELSLWGKAIFSLIVLILGIIQSLVIRQRFLIALISFVLLHATFALVISLISSYSLSIHLFYFIPSSIISLLALWIIPKKKAPQAADPWRVSFPVRKGSPVQIENLKRGLAIFGSAGAGKTESVFVPLIAHAARCGITGINYDYKDGELTEIVNHFYQDSAIKTYNIVPHRPRISHRVNPIHPDYIDSPEMVNELVSVLFANMRSESRGAKNFFKEVPEATLAGVIWNLKVRYPDFCTLPHAIAICLVKSPKELAAFLGDNSLSRLMAAPFFDSLQAKEQMAGVKATLSNDLRKFAYPSIFYVLSENEVDLRINNPDTPGFINLINSPGKEITLSPFLALVFTTTLKVMQKRGKLDSYLLLDEAATLNLPNFSKTPATMRSFNIATIYSLQDKVLGSEKYGDLSVRAILSNLSYQIIGKTNDPESVRYYKQISEEIKEKQYSRSFGTSFISKAETRKTESFRETSKYKNQDFFGLNTGEFIVFSDGRDRLVNFDLMPFDRISMKDRNNVTELDLKDNFDRILKEASKL